MQCGHRVATESTVIRQNGHAFVAASGAVAAGRTKAFMIRHATKPTIRKFRTAFRKLPSPKRTGPAPTVHCRHSPAGVTERWSFEAKEQKDPSAKNGEFQFTGKLFGVTVTVHGDIRCFAISGNRARLGGVVTRSNTPGFVDPDAEVVWSVEDNGEGSKAVGPDRATSLQFSDPEAYCALAPVPDPTLIPIETGNVQIHP